MEFPGILLSLIASDKVEIVVVRRVITSGERWAGAELALHDMDAISPAGVLHRRVDDACWRRYRDFMLH